MDVIYRITNWDDTYENNRSRGLKTLDWVPVPNRMDGGGYLELVEDHPNGAAHFGAWIAMVEIASRQKIGHRGELPHGDAGLAHSLAKKSRIPKLIFDEAIPRLLKLGWIQQDTDIQHEGAGLWHDDAGEPHDNAPSCARGREWKEGNGTEGNGTEEDPPLSAHKTPHENGIGILTANQVARSEWIEQRMADHPNKKDFYLGPKALAKEFGDASEEKCGLFEVNHKLFIGCEKWLDKNGAFASKMWEFVESGEWKKPPVQATSNGPPKSVRGAAMIAILNRGKEKQA